MEPSEKRQKLGQESVYQSSSKESSVVGGNLEENNNYIENAGNIVLNTKLPVCEEGANCNRTDLIHFAEFWHPTKTDEEENQRLEENECEVIELAGQDWEATQEVCEEEYSSSESDEGQDYNSNTIRKNKQQHSGSNSLDSQWVLKLWNRLNISSTLTAFVNLIKNGSVCWEQSAKAIPHVLLRVCGFAKSQLDTKTSSFN